MVGLACLVVNNFRMINNNLLVDKFFKNIYFIIFFLHVNYVIRDKQHLIISERSILSNTEEICLLILRENEPCK